ncbi:MAG: metal ABC transporter substrate-binding protein [Akkermansia sp.]
MNITKTLRYLLTASIIASSTLFIACEQKSDNNSQNKKSIVVATYPEYEWLYQIIGQNTDQFSVKLLMDSGVDAHSYEPTIQDIAAINKADLFIYNGGSSYKWVDRVLKLEAKEGRQTINLMESLEDEIQLLEGEPCDHDHAHGATCEHEHEHDASCEHEHGCEHHHAHEDEHIWLSLRNAIILCSVIEDAVSELTPTQSAELEANKQAYIAQLKALDERYTETAQKAGRDTLIIADRFPFVYLLHDYGIKHHAAFHGCSAETEASFETITKLSTLLKELKPHAILKVHGGMQKLAQTLITNSGQSDCQILDLYDFHTVPDANPASKHYLELMEKNRQAIEAALAP